VWSNLQADAMLLRLVQPPPAQASYAGWDPSPVPSGTTGIAFHHPRGDVIKASQAVIRGTNPASISLDGGYTYPPGAFYVVDWTSGIFEPGSVGAGLFTDAGDGSTYRLRVTLSGGRASCASPSDPLYYVPFQRQFALMQGFLTTPQAPIPLFDVTATVVEYYWAERDHYFMTADPVEIAALDAAPPGGWVRTGERFGAYAEPRTGASPVCRFYIPPESGDSHFFSAGAECAAVRDKFPTLTYETGSAFYIEIPETPSGCLEGSTRYVSRLWNNRADSNHRYTTNASIVRQMQAKGYVYEGAVMCAPHDRRYFGDPTR